MSRKERKLFQSFERIVSENRRIEFKSKVLCMMDRLDDGSSEDEGGKANEYAPDDPFAPVLFDEDSISTDWKNDHDESFESSTNVIDEAIDRALKLIDTASNNERRTGCFETALEENDTTLFDDENAIISLEDAVAIWKGFGKEQEPAPSPSLDLLLTKRLSNKRDEPTTPKASGRTRASKVEVDTLTQAMGVKISMEDLENPSWHNKKARTHEPITLHPPKGLFEATLDAVGMDKLLGIDEESLQKITNQNQCCNDDIFARLNPSPNASDDSISDETHPESLQQLLWDRLEGLCEPLQLELKDDETETKAIDITNSIASGTYH